MRSHARENARWRWAPAHCLLWSLPTRRLGYKNVDEALTLQPGSDSVQRGTQRHPRKEVFKKDVGMPVDYSSLIILASTRPHSTIVIHCLNGSDCNSLFEL